MNRKVAHFSRKVGRTSHGNQKARLALLGGLIFGILIISSVCAPLAVSFIKFKPNIIPLINESQNKALGAKKKILLVGIDKKNDEHIFVDALTLLVVDSSKSEVGLININPDILHNDDGLTLRRSLIGKSSYTELIPYVEELLATAISDIVVVNRDFFEISSRYTKSIEVSLPEDVRDEDVIANMQEAYWAKGKANLSSMEFYEFMQSDSLGRDDQLARQVEVYRHYTQSIDFIKIFLGPVDFFKNIEKNIVTTMSKQEMYKLYMFVRTIPAASYRTVYTRSDILTYIAKEGVYDKYRLNYEQFDTETEAILQNKEVLFEQPIVEVLNASERPGLARMKARWINNIGGELVHIANAPYVEAETKVYVKDRSKYTNTLIELKRILGEDTKFIEGEYPYRHIGDLVVVIGKNII